MSGSYFFNGLKTEAQLKVVNEGGEIEANSNGSISVTGADAVTLILACGTDYKMELPTFRGEDPHAAVTQRVLDAAQKGYKAVRQDHVADHSGLFSRLEISFNGDVPQIPTDELIQKYRNMVDGDGRNAPTESEQRALEVICYQFGRYLTIAGSREGALPTNLQGVWGEDFFEWGGDYHFNINVQMNYWPTMASNLGECLLPFNDYLEVLRIAGRDAAAAAFGIKSEEGEENGWLVGCFSTPYMFSALGQKNNAAGWNPTGSVWALMNAYEYYLYTGDVDYLREQLYPSMKEMANFWNEALWWSEAQQRYVSAPSYSPEHGPIVNGASYDQQFIWQHFENTIQAAEILGVDSDLAAKWKEKQSKLDPVLVGGDGQVKEWFEETTFGRAQAGDLEEIAIPRWQASLGAGEVAHRHLSHLMALYPGTLINKDNDEFMGAAKVSLNQRGLDATGWSKAHKLNLWARTGDGENCFKIVQSAVGGGNSGFLTNLFSSHGGGANYKERPIFQIDGNFGYTAGVNEMLLQSQLGYTQFLPALPEAWSDGYVEGIVARGNFVIDQYWSNGEADKFNITSRNGGEFIGEYNNLAAYTVRDSKGDAVAVTKLSNDKISFETEKGETYSINFNTEPDVPPVEKELESIEITTPPTKTRYTDGESFDPAGMVVTAHYSDGTTREIPAGQYTWSPNGALAAGNKIILVTYGENGVTAQVAITTAARPTDSGDDDSSTPPPVKVVDPETPLAGNAELNKENHIAYISGYEDGTVRPRNNITREEVAAIFYRLLTDASKDAYGTDTNRFSDVPSSRWSNRAISTLANAGIISGYPDGTFKPGQTITRAEFTVIAARFDTVTSASNPFTDTVGHWAEKQISFAASKGWVNGYPDGTFKPGQSITRGEAITLINNLLGRAVDASGLTEGVREWSDNEKGAWYYYNVLEATNSHEYTRRTEGEVMENWTGLTKN